MEDLPIEHFNIPIINSSLIIPQNHQMFMDYTSKDNYEYAINTFKFLCTNSHSKTKNSLFYKCIKIYLKVLYNCKNINFFSYEYDLLLITCFYLGLKTNEMKIRVPKITKLKEHFPQFQKYDTQTIKISEILCIKFLDYDFNMITACDFLYYLLKNNKGLYQLSLIELGKIMKNEPRNFMIQTPMELAKYSIRNVVEKNTLNKRLNSINYKKAYKTIVPKRNNLEISINNIKQYKIFKKHLRERSETSFKLAQKLQNISGILPSTDGRKNKIECYVKKKINDYFELSGKENKKNNIIGRKTDIDDNNRMKSYVQGINYYYSSIKKQNKENKNLIKRSK